MAAPNYSTDLTTIDDFEAATTISTEMAGYTATSKGSATDTDFPIQSSQHASAEQRTAATGSLAVDNGANITWTSGEAFFIWNIFLAPAAVNTDANGGIVAFVGSSINDHHRWTVGGNDFGRYPYGGWTNVVVDPEVTTGRTTTGAPGTNYRWIGFGCDVISAITKGSPYGLDVVRYGRGDLIVTAGDLANGYATFVGMAGQNDNSANRWGLFQETAGSYLWKGLMSLGTTATAVDFRDANRVITIDNTRRVQSGFNRIEVTNASSIVSWDSITFLSQSTTSRGQFECIDDATVQKFSCVFTDMDTFIYQSNSGNYGNIYRRCNQVTQGSATFSGCNFDKSTAAIALSVDTIASVTDCNFNSSGTGYAIEGFPTAGDYTLSGLTFSDYAATNGTTGNEAIHVTATTGTVNLNLVGGGLAPTIHTEGATVNVVQSAVLTLGRIREGSDVYVYRADTKAQLAGTNLTPLVTDGAPVDGVQYYKLVYSYNSATLNGVDVELKVLDEFYENIRQDYTLTASNATIEFQQRTDRNYENP